MPARSPTRPGPSALPNTLRDIPNVGPATEADLRLLGVEAPGDLDGRDPFQMYDTLCRLTGARHDPCVIDVFMATTDFAKTGEPRPWWAYTSERKRLLAARDAAPPHRSA